MPRLKIDDLPKDFELTDEQIKNTLGGGSTVFALMSSDLYDKDRTLSYGHVDVCKTPAPSINSPTPRPYPTAIPSSGDTKIEPATKEE